ncbi:MAG: periplasmic protein TonB [Verrucomicrobiota bacterium]
MTGKALLYQPRQRWRVGVALGAAALIHFAAIALANVHRVETTAGPPYADKFPEITIEPPSLSDDPITETPDPVPTIPKLDEFFPEERSTPPPVRRQINRPTAPIVSPTNNGPRRSLSESSAKVLAISAPRPEYPYEARRQRITGDGVVAMTIDPLTGRVTDVSMSKSTGNPFLDNAALTGFRKWRFKPGTVSAIKCPVTFTLTGASF